MNAVVWVAVGGALGSVTRYGFNAWVTRILGDAFPWGIMLVNVLGSFAIGLVAAFLMQRMPQNEMARLLIATGFLGGFTTFSAFALDVMKLAQTGQTTSAIAYVVASVGLSIIAVFTGFAVMRAVLT